MTIAKPTDKTVDWRNQTFWQRLQAARAILYMHGFLTESENYKVKRRLGKFINKGASER